MKIKIKNGILPRIKHWHKISALLAIYDIVAVNLAYFLALWFRFDCMFSQIPDHYLQTFLRFVPIYSGVCLILFWLRKLYHSIWRFASFNEFVRVLTTSVFCSVFHIAAITLIFQRMPVSYHIIGTAIQFVLVLGARFSYRLILIERGRRMSAEEVSRAKNVMLIGAGNAGEMILRDTHYMKKNNIRIRCIIDDNSNKWGRSIEGVPVVGGRNEILHNVKKYRIEKIFVAVPSASSTDKQEILNICKETGCELKNLPGIYQLVSDHVTLGDMQDVKVEDLLGRDPIQADMRQIYRDIRGRVILVTGGGGSIGSELCRQVAEHSPRQLIIFDVYENNAYDIQQELRERYPRLDLKVCIGSVRDSRRLNAIFETYKPDLVYHAAAHKHVPLMEDSPCEAIKNNVIGTYKTAYSALVHGCERFVLISTDKAVNPTNIMGASKRLCEMVIQSLDRAVREGKADQLPMLFTHAEEKLAPAACLEKIPYQTEFVAVRFGNVLGSNGSVIPLFKKQIAKGGPVTVTHPDIIRYFMTIPEAVSLVMQAGTYAHGGEIFVLDMGAPVKIDELARNLIKLSGHKPDEDIPVVYTGLRPGEKLYEEKLMAEEGMKKTANEMIHIGTPIPLDLDTFLIQLRELMDAAYENSEGICHMVAQMVPTYHPEQKAADQKDKTYAALCKEHISV